METTYIGKIKEKLLKIFPHSEIEYEDDKITINAYHIDSYAITKLTELDFVRSYSIFTNNKKNGSPLRISLAFDHVEFIDKNNIINILNKYFQFYNLHFDKYAIAFTTYEPVRYKALTRFYNDLSKENFIIEDIELIPQDDDYGNGYLDFKIEYKVKLDSEN